MVPLHRLPENKKQASFILFNEILKEQECEDLRKDIADAGNLNLALSDFLHIRVFPPLTLVCFFLFEDKKNACLFFFI